MRRRIHRASLSPSGFTLIELMIVVAIIAIVAAVALPSLREARISGNESSAIGSLRTLFTVQEQYRARFGLYPTTLAQLHSQGYAAQFRLDFLGVAKAGYSFQRIVFPEWWAIRANPIHPGVTGHRYFAVSARGVILWATGRPVVVGDPPLD